MLRKQERVIFDKKYTFNKNGLQIDKDGVLYAVTKNGKLWKGKLDGSSYEIIIPNLQANSLLLITELNNQQYILFTNEETVFALNNTLDLEYSFSVKSKIIVILFIF